MTATGRILVLRALGLGDLLTGVPALRALRAAFPDHEQVLCIPGPLGAWAVSLGLADRIVPTHGVVALPARLAGPHSLLWRPGVAVDLHGRGPASQPLLLQLRPRRLVAFHHPDVPGTAGGPAWRPGEHEVRRWCRLLEESGIAADPGRLELPSPPWDPGGPTVVHPGAASPARRWPADRFAAVARAERAAGRRVLLTGGAGERPLALEVARRAGLPPGAVLAGRTDLPALAAAVAAAGRVVCGDTGVAHLATAVGTPSVVLFGPVPPSEWGPPPDRPWHRVLWAGRRGDPHARTPDAGLLRIGVDDVLAALDGLPPGPQRAGAGWGQPRPGAKSGP